MALIAVNFPLQASIIPTHPVDNTKLSMEVLGLVLIRTRPFISLTVSNLDNNKL